MTRALFILFILSIAVSSFGEDLEWGPPAEQPIANQNGRMTEFEMIEDAQARAAAAYRLTPVLTKIMTAIKKVESHGWPWAICVNIGGGKSIPIYARSYSEAVYYVTHLKTDNLDIGPWQVNYIHWGRPYRLSKVDLLNPYVSAMMAAYKLSYEVSTNGYTWSAVGNYHSHTLSRKMPYVRDVMKKLREEGVFVD